MDLGSILFITAIFIIISIFITRPFLGYQTRIASEVEREMSALMAEYDRSIDALQELDFDHALGKIPAADYPINRSSLMERGVALLKQLDEIGSQLDHSDAVAHIETAIAEGRADSTTGVAEHAMNAIDDPLEKLITARRQESQSKEDGFCTGCGQPVQKTDRFCPKCGNTLAA